MDKILHFESQCRAVLKNFDSCSALEKIHSLLFEFFDKKVSDEIFNHWNKFVFDEKKLEISCKWLKNAIAFFYGEILSEDDFSNDDWEFFKALLDDFSDFFSDKMLTSGFRNLLHLSKLKF